MRKIISASLVTLVLFLMISAQSCKHQPDVTPNNNSTVATSSVSCDPDSVYFENSILPLLISSCAKSGCHDAASQEDGVILDNYTNIMKTGRVKAGNPSDSKLYEVVIETRSSKIMPPPPYNALSSEQQALIKKWIDQGAKNNKCIECDSVNVTFSKQVTSTLNANCVSCHNASSSSGGVSLHNYAAVKTNVDNGKLAGSINHRIGFVTMPPSGKLDNCNLTIINKWINDGAPNN